MKSIRRLFSFLCCAVMLCALCASPALASEETLSIVCTIFPAYDFARQLAGDTAQVRLLLPPGSESHSYEPSPKDIIDIQQADLFVYAGGESDSWVDGILASMGDDAPRTFRLTDCVTMLAEETSASMEQEVHDHGEEEAEMDEHVWTSPKNAMLIVDKLCDTLCEIAPRNAQAYEDSLSAYLTELEALDAAFEETVANGKRDLIVFGDRFPFRYFAHDYHLRYDAAFPGCSEDSEPSVRTVISLVETVRAEQIPVIFYIEFSSRKTADVLAEETGAKELLFHSCHNVSAEELEGGATYLSLMWNNVAALKEALS
ncbi:MAG: metal ABC transporter substrate-binding protein [Clostridiales bacterium]|nr:metal ABC transporter substrate-binding protein [Clostridiales bacterium]